MCVEEFDEESTDVNKNRKAQICKIFKLLLPLVNRTVDSPLRAFALKILSSR
jgi:hypothetical protein